MINYLNNLGRGSRLAEHWINQPVLIMMMYVRAEHEGELPLHLHTCKVMMLYYFAASHWNYARDWLNYICMMKNLSLKAFESILKGQHVLHLMYGIFNGIWSDMGIVTT